MAIAVGERTDELAVLKAVGFSDRFVLGLVLAESLLIRGRARGVGLMAARGIVSGLTRGLILMLPAPPRARHRCRADPRDRGLLAGLLPAVGAMRLSVVDAMRRI